MEKSKINNYGLLLAHAFIGWTLCAAAMGISMSLMSEKNALIAHAIAAPVIFAAVSFVYFNKFNYTSPLRTAFVFVLFAIAMDFFVVALLVLKSLEMFTSPLGTWIPFALIFLSTFWTGKHATK
jgi:hypothetical protein